MARATHFYLLASEMAIDIGLIAYNKYCEQTNREHPPWNTIGKIEQDAWRHAAVAVSQYLEECRIRMEEHPKLVG